jgi:hypothetical protein
MKARSARPLALALPVVLATLTVGLAACQEGDAPWLTMPSDEEHAARFFPITAGSAHAELTCNDCHGETGGFGQFDCLNCHLGSHSDPTAVTSFHSGITGFEWASAACYRCHRDGTATGIDHQLVFPLPHRDATCVECHVQPGDRSVLGCAGCHGHEKTAMDDKHQGRSGYVFESRACYECHPRGQGDN